MCAICICTGKSSLNSRSHGVDLTRICLLMKRAHTFCMMFMRSWYSSFGFLKESNTVTRARSILIQSKIKWKLLLVFRNIVSRYKVTQPDPGVEPHLCFAEQREWEQSKMNVIHRSTHGVDGTTHFREVLEVSVGILRCLTAERASLNHAHQPIHRPRF